MTEEPAVEARHAARHYGSAADPVKALDDVSVTIRKGEFFTLLGPSGCGKTTLLRLIAGFETPTHGQILLSGKDITAIPPNERRVNTVFQSYALFPHLSVARNIAFGLEMLGRPKSEIGPRVAEMLALVQLEQMAERKPAMLSGGQQQRVALARALAPQPEVLLLDEPLSALDLKLRKEMQLELKRLQTETGITFIFVTHDQEEALTMSDRIGVMNAGKIQQIGGPRDIYNGPVNRFVADFIGETNFLTGTLSDGRVKLPTGEVLDIGAVGQGEVTLAIRPEQIRITDDGPLEATLTQTVYFGTDSYCHLALKDGTEVVARLQSPPSGDIGLTAGQQIRLSPTAGSVQVLEGD